MVSFSEHPGQVIFSDLSYISIHLPSKEYSEAGFGRMVRETGEEESEEDRL